VVGQECRSNGTCKGAATVRRKRRRACHAPGNHKRLTRCHYTVSYVAIMLPIIDACLGCMHVGHMLACRNPPVPVGAAVARQPVTGLLWLEGASPALLIALYAPACRARCIP
jgi:hypothetical protein